MSITLDHTVLASSGQSSGKTPLRRDHAGLELGEREGVDGKFVSVCVNAVLRLFFVSSDRVTSQHLAFVVDDPTFDQILARLRQQGVFFGNSPRDPKNGRTDHPLAPRGLFWTDPDGHLFELMTTPPTLKK